MIIARFSASRMAAPLAWDLKFRDVYLLMAALRLTVAGRVRERRERAVATMLQRYCDVIISRLLRARVRVFPTSSNQAPQLRNRVSFFH